MTRPNWGAHINDDGEDLEAALTRAFAQPDDDFEEEEDTFDPEEFDQDSFEVWLEDEGNVNREDDAITVATLLVRLEGDEMFRAAFTEVADFDEYLEYETQLRDQNWWTKEDVAAPVDDQLTVF